MKTTGWRSLVLYILGAGLLAGLIFFVVTFFLDGGSWAMRSNNQHLSQGSQLGGAGSITDRDGVVVALSVDGQRIYADDATTREALLHVVGDTAGFISTSTQAAFRSQLTGYNPVMGVGSLKNNQNGSNIQLTVSSSLSRLALESLGGTARSPCTITVPGKCCAWSAPPRSTLKIPPPILTATKPANTRACTLTGCCPLPLRRVPSSRL